jgi:hypothetical protein
LPDDLFERPSWVLIDPPAALSSDPRVAQANAQLDQDQLDEIVRGLRLLIED